MGRLAWLKSLRRKVVRTFLDSDYTSPTEIDPYRLGRALLGPEPPFAWFTGFDFSQRNMIASMLRMPQYRHAASARRTIGRATTRDVIGLSHPADAKHRLAAVRLGNDDPLVRLVPRSPSGAEGGADAALRSAAPVQLSAEWTFGTPDDIVPGVSRLLRHEGMLTPEDVLASATRDDRDELTATGPAGAGATEPDLVGFNARDPCQSGSALIGGMRPATVTRLRRQEAKRRWEQAVLASQAAIAAGNERPQNLLPRRTSSGAAMVSHARQAAPPQKVLAPGLPLARDARMAIGSERILAAGLALTNPRPTLPGWEAVSAIAAQRAAAGMADSALTPVASDSVAELALHRSRSPLRLRWSQLAPSRPPVPPAPVLLEALREQASVTSLRQLTAPPRERVRAPGLLRALEAMGVTEPGSVAHGEWEEDGAPAKAWESMPIEPRPVWWPKDANCSGTGASTSTDDDVEEDEEGPDRESAGARQQQYEAPAIEDAPLDASHLAAQHAVTPAALAERLSESLRFAGIDFQGKDVAEGGGISSEAVEAARTALAKARRARITMHPVPTADQELREDGRVATRANEGGGGELTLSDVFAQLSGAHKSSPPQQGLERSTLGGVMASMHRSSSAIDATRLAIRPLKLEGISDEEEQLRLAAEDLVDAEEDSRFRTERRRALQRRKQLREFVEKREQQRLSDAQAWLDSKTRARVPEIDGPEFAALPTASAEDSVAVGLLVPRSGASGDRGRT